MIKKKSVQRRAAGLRRRAEKKAIAGAPVAKASLSPKETRRTLHELHVHQIELEMQNEELLRVQAELEAARARYFDLYDLAPIGYFTISEKGLIIEANLTAAVLLGVGKALLVKQPFSHFILGDDQDTYYHHQKRLFQAHQPQVCDVRILRREGGSFWARLESTVSEEDMGGAPGPHRARGKVVCRTVMSDISRLKAAEEKTRKSEELLIETEMMGGIGGWSFDAEKATETWTDQTYRIFEIALTRDLSKGRGGLDLIAPSSRPQAEQAIRKAIDAGVPYDQEWEIITARNNRRWVRAAAKPRMEKGRVRSLTGFFQDISELKQAEEKLRNSLAEKELLLKEVHHRVKNNLMTVVGLIQMQEEKAGNEQVGPLIRELEGRVRSIALVHEILHNAERQSCVSLQNYFESMISHIRNQFGAERDIRCVIQAAGAEVRSDRAVVYGLIMNELITNAYKHAFPGGRPGDGTDKCEIAVTVQHDDDHILLTVADNGIGLPSGSAWENPEALGLRLVKMLCGQLNGSIELDRTRGTAFRLRFANSPAAG